MQSHCSSLNQNRFWLTILISPISYRVVAQEYLLSINPNTMRLTDPLQNLSAMTSFFNATNTSHLWQPAGRDRSQRMEFNFAHYPTVSADFEGPTFNYSPDARGNVTQTIITPEGQSGLTPISMAANYDASCSFAAKCNQPNWTRDPNGNQTDFEYDLQTGLPTRITSPADANGVRSVRRYTYVQRYAWIKNIGGGYTQSSSPVWLLAAEKTCSTTATIGDSCSGGPSDEVTVNYDYELSSGPNNLLLVGKVVSAGGVSLRTCYGYDIFGNTISETTPRAGRTSC